MIAMSGMGGPPQGAGNSIIVNAFHSALTRQGLLIFVVLLVLVVAWNALRSVQYRRAAASGIPWPPPPRLLAPEPVARRVLRVGFALIWVFDGLLQAQASMPTGLATQVLRPAAATSPGWVQHLVDFGATTWALHPVPAAAATVWIQVGIGVFLLVAPRGRWSRAAGVVSLGWALVVWSFGEAFGGVFAPGLTVLFGAPGAVLFYAVAGGLIALPDRAWGRTPAGADRDRVDRRLPARDGRAAGLARSGVLAGGHHIEPRHAGRDGGSNVGHRATARPLLGRLVVRVVRPRPRLGGEPVRGGGAGAARPGLLVGSTAR